MKGVGEAEGFGDVGKRAVGLGQQQLTRHIEFEIELIAVNRLSAGILKEIAQAAGREIHLLCQLVGGIVDARIAQQDGAHRADRPLFLLMFGGLRQIAQQQIAKPADVLELGQVVDVKIIAIDEEKQKVSLSIRALLDEAQAAAEAMPEEYAAEAAEAPTAE